MREQDYKLLEYVLKHSKPKIVTLEYSGLEDESEEFIICSLKEQLCNITELCNRDSI